MSSSSDAPRLLLFADGPRSAPGRSDAATVRRYRLARLQPAPRSRRPDGEPRYAYLKRSYG